MKHSTSAWSVSFLVWGLIWFAILFFGSVIYISYVVYEFVRRLKQLKRFLTPSGEYPSRGEEK